MKASVKDWMGSRMASLVSLLSWTEFSNTRNMSPDILVIFTLWQQHTWLTYTFCAEDFFFSLLFWSLASHQNSRCGLVFSPCSSLSLYYYHSQLQVAKLLKAKFGMRHIVSKPTIARWLYFTNTIGSNNLWSTSEEERYGTTRGQWTLSIAK